MQRTLSQQEQRIIQLAEEKFGKSEKDELFFLETGEAILQVWGKNGDGPWIHISNLAKWLTEGSITENEIKDSQM